MKAVVLEEAGSPDRLRYQEIPTPEVTPGHVLVRVGACAVAQRDLVERRGGHPFLQTPIVQGHEFAGEIVEVGPGVTRWSIGDRVVCLYTDSCGDCDACARGDERRCSRISESYGLTVNGGYAQFALVHERGLAPLADGLSFEVGACMLSAIGVGFNNVKYKAAVQPDETVLVTGASGGVGLAALQTVKLLDAHPWALTTSQEKAGRLEEMGAEVVIVDPGDSFHRQVRQRRPDGVDAVIDCVGSSTLGSSIKSTRRYGRVVAIGTIDPAPLSLKVGSLVVHAIDLLGSDNVTLDALGEAMVLVRDGKIDVVIDRTLPLSEAAEAHRLLEARAAFGRIVLVP
ncbi:MAG: alcohol dehydrogenase catalytic domain-containing protein [Deltaproteobacteria bacterium]|nr:alcohol dehydrogenase catalytic domain-containing protein [Deltaproteobacteria bacterium]MBW2361767.1 alcohol dehydrogenase catalytic domain-containing protein [Deltaproteobacteria bacterium]